MHFLIFSRFNSQRIRLAGHSVAVFGILPAEARLRQSLAGWRALSSHAEVDDWNQRSWDLPWAFAALWCALWQLPIPSGKIYELPWSLLSFAGNALEAFLLVLQPQVTVVVRILQKQSLQATFWSFDLLFQVMKANLSIPWVALIETLLVETFHDFGLLSSQLHQLDVVIFSLFQGHFPFFCFFDPFIIRFTILLFGATWLLTGFPNHCTFSSTFIELSAGTSLENSVFVGLASDLWSFALKHLGQGIIVLRHLVLAFLPALADSILHIGTLEFIALAIYVKWICKEARHPKAHTMLFKVAIVMNPTLSLVASWITLSEEETTGLGRCWVKDHVLTAHSWVFKTTVAVVAVGSIPDSCCPHQQCGDGDHGLHKKRDFPEISEPKNLRTWRSCVPWRHFFSSWFMGSKLFQDMTWLRLKSSQAASSNNHPQPITSLIVAWWSRKQLDSTRMLFQHHKRLTGRFHIGWNLVFALPTIWGWLRVEPYKQEIERFPEFNPKQDSWKIRSMGVGITPFPNFVSVMSL